MPKLEIYTDGGARGNGKANCISGWGYVVFKDGVDVFRDSGGAKNKTNNQMEMTAMLVAMETVLKVARKKPVDEVLFRPDSKYVMQGIEDWMPNWKRNNWRTAAKKPVKNQDLWMAIDKAYEELKTLTVVKFKHVYGHQGDHGNEIADSLCNMEMDKLR